MPMHNLSVRRFMFPFAIIVFLAVGVAELRADDPFDFGPVVVPPGERPAQPPHEEPPRRTPEDAAIARDIADLAKWPGRVGSRAAESLLLRGDGVVAPLCDVLARDESPMQPGAAWVLGHVGEASHVPLILRAAARRRNGSRAEVFFEAAHDLDPKRAKDWLFSLLPLKRPVFRAKATDFLIDHMSPDDGTRVVRLLDSPKTGVRTAALRLLGAAQVPDTVERILEALADPAPEVARTASILLAFRADDALVKRLNELAAEGFPRERAYAILALVEVARTQNESRFETATLAELAGRRGLLHPEKLSRGAAAVGLAFGAIESKDPNLAALLDRTVVDVLIDTVGGEHFRDHSSLSEPVFSALRRLSGLDLPATAVAWAIWWRTERERFQARRPLLVVLDEDLPFAFVRFEVVASDGGRRRATFRSEDGSVQVGEYALGRDAFKALVEAIEEAGIYEVEGADEVRADEHVLVTLGVMNQKRRMAVPSSDPRHALLRMRMDSLEDTNLWQHYRDTDRWPNAAEWWRTQAEVMAAADPSERTELLRAAIVHAYDDLPTAAARAEALDRLENLRLQDEKAGSLSADEARALVSAATAAIAFGELEVRAVEYALSHEAASRVRGDLVEALASRTEPGACDLLARLLARGGPLEVRDAFADPRPGLRGAAARAAQALLEESRILEPEDASKLASALRPGLEVLARDDEGPVAVRAIVALQRMGDGGGVVALERLYKAGDRGAKIAVIEALGEMPADEAWPFFSLVLAEERAPGADVMRAAALKSMARTGHPRAAELLVFYLLNDANRSVRVAAGDALVDEGSDGARYVLIRALTEGQPDAERRARLVDTLGRFHGDVVRSVLGSYLEDRDPTVSHVAALRLADLGEARTVPYLIEVLRGKSPAMAQAALRALENVTYVCFDLTGHEVLAEQYERWYQTARITSVSEPERAWFRAALRERGYDVGLLAGYLAGEADPTAVPVLIRALRDEDAVVRRGAARALARITGLSMGEVRRSTSLRDATAVADQWARWWARIRNPAGDAR